MKKLTEVELVERAWKKAAKKYLKADIRFSKLYRYNPLGVYKRKTYDKLLAAGIAREKAGDELSEIAERRREINKGVNL